MGVAVNCALIVDRAAFGGPGRDERLKACFVNLIERDVQKGHRMVSATGKITVKWM